MGQILSSKRLEGLNFRDVEGFNQALVAKQVWRILTKPDSLVSRFMKSIYFRNSNILDAELEKKRSYLWRSLLWGRELLARGIRYRIGNGLSTSMFKDPWIPKVSTFKPICIRREAYEDSVADYINPNGEWNLLKLSENVHEDDIKIKRIPINKELSDKCIWHYDKIGKYSVKSGYKSFMNFKIETSSSVYPMGKVWENLWKLKVSSKIKHLCWRALNNMIPMDKKLHGKIPYGKYNNE